MAFECIGFSYPFVAAADLSASQFRGVALDANGKINVPAAAGGQVIGVLNNKPKVNEAGTVYVSGISIMEAGASIVLAAGGTRVSVDAAGRAITWATTNYLLGYALEAASGIGVKIAVLLLHGGPTA